jgi:hypothetical protein
MALILFLVLSLLFFSQTACPIREQQRQLMLEHQNKFHFRHHGHYYRSSRHYHSQHQSVHSFL